MLPDVGFVQNDHVSIPVAWEVPVVESLTYLATSPLKGALEFFKYIFTRTGLLSMPILVLSLFVRGSSLDDKTSDFIAGIPSIPSKTDDKISVLRSQEYLSDIELMPLATSAMDNFEEHKLRFSKIGVFSVLATLLRPKSRGTVRLASSNPQDRPKIDFGFMRDPADFGLARKAVRLAIKLGDAMKAQGFPIMRSITAPESEKDDKGIDKLIRHRARTTYHYSSTCRMAPESDPQVPGVVNGFLQVHGVSNLRVCDASVFPQIVTSHLQAPVVMVAEKCADMIKSKAKES